MENKKVIVEVKFLKSKNDYTVRLRALHNGKYLIAKHKFTSNKDTVFDIAYNFIEEYDATNISIERGFIEDSFVKYMQKRNKEENEIREKEKNDSQSEEEQKEKIELLALSESCDLSFKKSIESGDYEDAIIQSFLKRNILEELNEETDIKYEAKVPKDESDKILESIKNINNRLDKTSDKLFEIEQNSRRITIKRDNIEITFKLYKKTKRKGWRHD